jgi:hypothetical protein
MMSRLKDGFRFIRQERDMKRIALTILMVLVIGGATGEAAAAPLIQPKAEKCTQTKSKVKKRRSFKSFLAKSAGFVAESAVNGGMSDR